jgi:hypothetical protein
MTGTELEHANNLELRRRAGDIQWFKSKPLRLILAKGMTYEPDFLVMNALDLLEFHETKGPHAAEDSIVKIKAAAELFPIFEFQLWQRARNGDWTCEVIGR